MCKEFGILGTDGEADYVCTKGEIERRLGGPVPGLEGDPDNGCLCNLDEDATAKLYGYTFLSGWSSHGVDIIMVPIGVGIGRF